jgi:hypothetical protein
MSYHIWTAEELLSSSVTVAGICWRIVEAQHQISTLKIVDTEGEQARLEEILETEKPPYPPEMEGYHFLLRTPFRYKPYMHGSRFRRQNQSDGAFYAAEKPETAMAEIAFHKLLFFLESPNTPIPKNAFELTGFSVKYETRQGLDLTCEPLAKHRKLWTDTETYEHCQSFADIARLAGIEVIQFESVCCPDGGKNLALLSWRAFADKDPVKQESWHLTIKPEEVVVRCESSRKNIIFDRSSLENDHRIVRLKAGND